MFAPSQSYDGGFSDGYKGKGAQRETLVVPSPVPGTSSLPPSQSLNGPAALDISTLRVLTPEARGPIHLHSSNGLLFYRNTSCKFTIL